MRSFSLKIVTPDGLVYEGTAEELIVRTTTGEMGILAGHMNCVAPLGMGRATVLTDGQRRYAACIGGMVTVVDNKVSLVATTFEWAEDIDLKRAEASETRAKTLLSQKELSQQELRMAEARLKRALIRKSVAQIGDR